MDDANGKANIQVETNIKISDLGDNFENLKDWFIDYLLLDNAWFPICVLEAKSEDKDPLIGKEQARIYANTENVRFIILSNGNIHYFWDKEKGNPTRISHFPTLESFEEQKEFTPNLEHIINEEVGDDYIAKTQFTGYKEDPKWLDLNTRAEFMKERGLKFLRQYQVDAIKAVQKSIKTGNNRFLWEMATGTGKTLTAAGIIKLFLKTGLAKRVLFLVDRLELEDQAKKAFTRYLGNDFETTVFKENRDNRQKAEIVVTTIQSISYNNKYLKLFAPTDFDLIISDEAHRSISGWNRVIFEYFIAYKLGLTATPKDYLKNIDKKQISEEDPRNIERRQLLSTYQTFGCESGEPTFRYSLLDGVKDGFLINPKTINCQTDITTQLLSEEWYAVDVEKDTGESEEVVYKWWSFERKFFSEKTNREFCLAFMKNALKDPISGEIGKTIFFCVSRHHAGKITQMLNELAHEMFPGKYNSDFAMQITSDVAQAQQFTINFSNGNLGGYTKFLEWYKSSKTRVCVTVGMMTTGYDCEDILNLCLARPIFSPSDFVQMKGRWTRTFTFEYQDRQEKKSAFKLFDFFENCRYFEEDYPYDQVLDLPKIAEKKIEDTKPEFTEKAQAGIYESAESDYIVVYEESEIWDQGMRIDRELYISWFEKTLKEQAMLDEAFKQAVESKNYEFMESYVKANIFDRPTEYYNLARLREWYKTDRKISFWEILDYIFFKKKFKTKNDIAEEEFEKYTIENGVSTEQYYYAKEFFKYYLVDEHFRSAVNAKEYREFAWDPEITQLFQALGKEKLQEIPDYIQDNVVLNKFY